MFVDTHCHLDDPAFNGDPKQIIRQMQQKNVVLAINNSCDLTTMKNGIALAENYDSIYATIGMHPEFAKDFDDSFVCEMEKYAKNKKVVAVGEIGLDYHYGTGGKQIQKDVFAYQIEIADKLKLPLALHIRDSYGDTVDILTAQKKYLNNGVLWHCYSGSSELARQMAKLGHYFAFGGAITFKNARKEEVLSQIPISQVLTETDSPYMAPVPFRGQINTPCNIPIILAKLAQIYQVDEQKIQDIVLNNTLKFFTKIKL